MIARRRLRALANPILVREVRTRMRGGRAPLAVTVFLALVGVAGYSTYSTTIANNTSAIAVTTAGAGLFIAMASVVIALVVLLAPGICASTITGEREKQTLDLLLVTRMRAGGIVVGKLLSSLLFIFLLIAAALPLFSVVFLLGGIRLRDVVVVAVFAATLTVLLGAAGMFFSSLMRRTAAATLSTYLVVFLIVAAPGLALAASQRGSIGNVFAAYPPNSCPNFFGPSPPGNGPPGCRAEPPGAATVLTGLVSPWTATAGVLDPVSRGSISGNCGGIGGLGTAVIAKCFSPGLSSQPGTIAAGALFGGWPIWAAALLVDSILAALLLVAAVLLLRRRLPRAARPSTAAPLPGPAPPLTPAPPEVAA